MYLRIVHDDYTSSFKDLLRKASCFTIHQKNTQLLAIELFKVFKGIANPILDDGFHLRYINYNLKYQTDFSVNSAKNSHFGFNSLQDLASKVWNAIVPEQFKKFNYAEIFKSQIKKWEPTQCKCKLCLPYIQNVGYVNISNC